MATTTTLILGLLSLGHSLQTRATGTTPLVRTYEGDTFFDRWDYYGYYDNTTEGDVEFVNPSTATSTPKLTYTTTSSTSIIKVDNTSTVSYNNKRNSIKITSKDSYPVGSVFVLDVLHLPYGCSVWPAFWMYDTSVTWPLGGEIDVIEGVNNQVGNQMALHTEDGCAITTSSTSYSGIVNSTSCYYSNNSNSGCGITDTSSLSYGADFASSGGGIWVTELATTGISIWFFSRADVPDSLTSTNTSGSGSIDTSGLGTPSGFWSDEGCEIDKYFGEQTLVFDITLCGSWAGVSSILASTGCSALSGSDTCYSTYVLDSNNYDEAYFEINSLKVYSNTSTSANDTSSSTTTSAALLSLPRVSWLSSFLVTACLLLSLGLLG